MKAIYTTLALVLLATLAFAQSDARQAVDQIKTLDGTWSGKNSQGEALKITFRETAGGSAILSEIEGGHSHDMVSMIHVDNDRLLMTHYCSTGNQPRMSARVGGSSAQTPRTSDMKPGTISSRPPIRIKAPSITSRPGERPAATAALRRLHAAPP